MFAGYWTHTRLTIGAAVCSLALLFSLSLWKLLKPPPRFSATRCSYLLISVFAVVLLLHW